MSKNLNLNSFQSIHSFIQVGLNFPHIETFPFMKRFPVICPHREKTEAGSQNKRSVVDWTLVQNVDTQRVSTPPPSCQQARTLWTSGLPSALTVLFTLMEGPAALNMKHCKHRLSHQDLLWRDWGSWRRKRRFDLLSPWGCLQENQTKESWEGTEDVQDQKVERRLVTDYFQCSAVQNPMMFHV